MSSLTELLTQEMNQNCADCSSPNVTHLSTKFGTFLCNGCAKIHKEVLSEKTESLPCDELKHEIAENIVNETLEARLPHFYTKPTVESSTWAKEHFISSKYSKEIFSSIEKFNKSNIEYREGNKNRTNAQEGKEERSMETTHVCSEEWNLQILHQPQ